MLKASHWPAYFCPSSYGTWTLMLTLEIRRNGNLSEWNHLVLLLTSPGISIVCHLSEKISVNIHVDWFLPKLSTSLTYHTNQSHHVHKLYSNGHKRRMLIKIKSYKWFIGYFLNSSLLRGSSRQDGGGVYILFWEIHFPRG